MINFNQNEARVILKALETLGSQAGIAFYPTAIAIAQKLQPALEGKVAEEPAAALEEPAKKP